MARQKQNAFAAGAGALEVFKTVVHDDAVDVFAGVTREQAELGELAAEGDVFSAKNTAAIARVHFGEGEGEVAHADAAQSSVNEVDDEAEGDAFGAREGAGKQADGLHPQPDDPVFETLTH